MPMIDKVWTPAAMAAPILACVLAASGPTTAQSTPAVAPVQNAGQDCGGGLSEPVRGAWRDMGAEAGRLGCPTQREMATSTSPKGSAARAAVFGLNGEIILHVSGPRVGQVYTVWGCAYRLLVQFGGTSGWLGLPIGEAENIPDGSRQAFEGGSIRYTRAYDDCEATPAVQSAVAAAPIPLDAETPLDVFENPATGDRLSLAAGGSVAEALSAGYLRLRGQARVLTLPSPGALPLKLYWNEAGGLRETLASIQSEQDALAAGYVFEASQGFVWPDPRPGTLALKLFREPATGRTRLTAGAGDESEALAKGYGFLRIEGYADPAL